MSDSCERQGGPAASPVAFTTAAHAQRVKDIVEQIRQSGDDALL
jgi:hypothetical protein